MMQSPEAKTTPLTKIVIFFSIETNENFVKRGSLDLI